MKRLLHFLIAPAVLALAVSAAPARADIEVAGVNFDDQARLGNSQLVLNGAGLRTRVFFKVYALGLYLPEKKTAAEAVINAPGPKRIHIVTLRDLSAEQLSDALVSAFERNHSEVELAPLKARLDEFRATMLGLGDAAANSTVLLDFLPESGTRLQFNGAPRGKDIPGEDFYRGLLKIWLGQEPAQEDLKEALLGTAP